ncbi:MAG: CBM20 domain-containing protein [Candidatus Krumholzibacteriia bacterium]
MNLIKQATGALGLLGLAVAVTSRSRSRAPRTVTVTWSVRVPPSTPDDEPLYLTGNLPALGPWNPKGLQLHRIRPDAYIAKLQIPPATGLEYKFTRGSWETVEATENGQDRPNRNLLVSGPEQVFASVDAWADRV